MVAAAAARSSRLFVEVLPWLLVLLGIVVAGAVVVMLARRLTKDAPSGPPQGFTLQELRELHAAGELTDEQFERARAVMIGRWTEPSTPKEPDAPPADDPG